MTVLHHIEYLETRENWLVTADHYLTFTTNFDKGPALRKSSGWKRKKDCIARIEAYNNAAGYEVCRYYGKVNH